MNINMLSDLDDDYGHYVVVRGVTPADWSGCDLFSSIDGTTFTELTSILTAGVMGSMLNTLGDFTRGNVVDEYNKINVTIFSDTMLTSTTRAGLLSGVNCCVVGDEIIYFRDAVQEGDGSWTLSGLLRGRRGSEAQIATHIASERFVLYNSGVKRVAGTAADIGVAKTYKARSVGSTLAAATAYPFTNLGAGLKPYAVAHLAGGRNASGDLIAKWKRRTRVSGSWRNSFGVPLGETSEAYVAEIWTSGFGTLKRTVSWLSSPTFTYTAAQQTTDFGAPQSAVAVRVYQVSATVGRGYPAQATI